MSERQPVKPNRALMWKLLSPMAGSSSPLYQQLDWRKFKDEGFMQVGPYDVLFHEVDGDEQAIPGLARSWKMLGRLSVPANKLERAHRDFPDLTEAVAYNTPKGSRVGLLPEGVRFTQDGPNDYERSVYMRLGAGPLRATMGLSDGESIFIEPPGVLLESGHRFNLIRVEEQHPNALLV